jgi:hypothetical protein
MISVLYLSNGVTLIGEVRHEMGPVLIVRNPVEINVKNSEEDADIIYGKSFLPFLNKDTVVLNRHLVLAYGEPTESLAKYYNGLVEGSELEDKEMSETELQEHLDASDEEESSLYIKPTSNTIH